MALIYTGAALLSTFSLAGIDFSYARYYFSADSRDTSSVEAFCWRFAITSSLLLATAVLGLLSLTDVTLLIGDYILLYGAALLAVLGCLRTMAETRRRLGSQYRRIALGLLMAGVLTPAFSVVFGWYWRQDAWALLMAALIGVLVNIGILGMPSVSRLLHGPSLESSLRWEVVNLGLPGIATATMFWALGFADRWILAAYADHEVVGIYAFASNLAAIGLMLNSAITLTWFPEATRTYEADRINSAHVLGRLWARLVVGLVLVWLVVASVGGDVLRLIADSRFHEGAVYIPWVAAGVFFNGVASLANTGLMLGKNMRPAAYAWVVAGAASVCLNILIVPIAGALGAAIVSCLAYAGICVAVMTMAQHVCPLIIPWRRLTVAMVIVVTCGGVLSAWSITGPLFSVAVKLPIVAAGACVAGAIVAPDWARRGILQIAARWQSLRRTP